MPCEWRDDQHLAHIARPHDEKQRVVLDEILCRRVERREAEAREQEDWKRPPCLEILQRPNDALNRRAKLEVQGRGFAHAVVRNLQCAEPPVLVQRLVSGVRPLRIVGPRSLGLAWRSIGTLFGALRKPQVHHDRNPPCRVGVLAWRRVAVGQHNCVPLSFVRATRLPRNRQDATTASDPVGQTPSPCNKSRIAQGSARQSVAPVPSHARSSGQDRYKAVVRRCQRLCGARTACAPPSHPLRDHSQP